MKLHATIGGLQVDVEIHRQGGHISANVDGREYELEAQQDSPALLLQAADGSVFNCRVEGDSSTGRPIDVFVGACRYTLTLTDPKRLRATAAAGGQTDGAARIVAPMPGKIVRVLVDQGAAVEIGTGIVVVEAMKMQNEMKAPKTGVVAAINVTVGATVNGGDVLAISE